MRRALLKKIARPLTALGALALTLTIATSASAETRSVSHAVFGTEASGYDGWSEIITRVTSDRAAFDGEVALQITRYSEPSDNNVLVRVPIHVDAGRSAVVHLPMQLRHHSSGSVQVVVRDSRGEVVQRESPSLSSTHQPLLVCLDRSFPVANLRGAQIPSASGTRGSYESGIRVSVGTPEQDPATDLPILPSVAAAYNTATVVVTPATLLARLAPTDREILMTWVRSGGTLAVVHPAGSAAPPWAPADGSRETKSSVGLGRVYTLATESSQNDTWLNQRLLMIAGEAWDGPKRTILPIGSGGSQMNSYDGIRRALDPNEGFRPALGVAALALVTYAALMGPIAFAFARRRRRPFLPLLTTPALSLGAFAIVVGVGYSVKGFTGRALHLSYVEATSGETTATVRHFRAFYTSDSRTLTVPALADGSTLDATREDVAQGTLQLGGKPVLQNVRTMPWQPVIVREDGLTSLGGGIVIEHDGVGATVTNKTNRDLRDVIVVVGAESHAFGAIGAGERVTTNGHTPTRSSVLHRGRTTPGDARFAAIDWYAVRTAVPNGAAIADAWAPLESGARYATDWAPDDAPLVLARMAGGPDRDSGLPVKTSTTLVRVTGWAGAK